MTNQRFVLATIANNKNRHKHGFYSAKRQSIIFTLYHNFLLLQYGHYEKRIKNRTQKRIKFAPTNAEKTSNAGGMTRVNLGKMKTKPLKMAGLSETFPTHRCL
jgi:hypothetical protein